jgi:hypothetical protein
LQERRIQAHFWEVQFLLKDSGAKVIEALQQAYKQYVSKRFFFMLEWKCMIIL